MEELGYTGMDSVFNDYEDDPMDSVFDDGEGDLIDYVSGLNEDGSSELDADFDELHNEDDEAEPEDFEDTLGPDNDTPGAPTMEKDSPVDAALGEGANDNMDFDDGGDDPTANAFEGKKVNPDERNLDKESDNAIDSALGEGVDCEDGECDGSTDDDMDDDDNDPVDDSLGESTLDGEDDDDLSHEPGDEELIDMVMSGQA